MKRYAAANDNDRSGRARDRQGVALNAASNHNAPAPDARPAYSGQSEEDFPVVVVRFPALYAWMAIGFAGLFFLLGLVFAVLNRRNPVPGLSISAISVAAVLGANYWRLHLHVVAQLSPRQLVLRRDGAVNWGDIAELELKTIRASYRATPSESQFICIKLRSRPAPRGALDGFLRNAKRAISGYDIIVPASELSCGADWFVAECRKRMAATPAPSKAAA
jgi:hypothetical protein